MNRVIPPLVCARAVRNIRLEIEYDGTDYCGWQTQSRNKCKKSIQEVIEKALRKILRKKIKLSGSGRTDSGVHASSQVANFNTDSGIPCDKLRLALNGALPEDISVSKVEEANNNFHSRFSAKSKIYRYTILNRRYRSALLRGWVYFYPHPLDLKVMQDEARSLLGRHDFSAFRAADKLERQAVRTIKKIKVSGKDGLVHIDIEADGFLYNMVRNIVGTLVEVGRGRFNKGCVKRILDSGDRRLAGPTLPACGLCLMKVKY